EGTCPTQFALRRSRHPFRQQRPDEFRRSLRRGYRGQTLGPAPQVRDGEEVARTRRIGRDSPAADLFRASFEVYARAALTVGDQHLRYAELFDRADDIGLFS